MDDYELMMRRERDKYLPGMHSSPAWMSWASHIVTLTNTAKNKIERRCEQKSAKFLARLAPYLLGITPAPRQKAPIITQVDWDNLTFEAMFESKPRP